jgi:hypothetical protein
LLSDLPDELELDELDELDEELELDSDEDDDELDDDSLFSLFSPRSDLLPDFFDDERLSVL